MLPHVDSAAKVNTCSLSKQPTSRRPSFDAATEIFITGYFGQDMCGNSKDFIGAAIQNIEHCDSL